MGMRGDSNHIKNKCHFQDKEFCYYNRFSLFMSPDFLIALLPAQSGRVQTESPVADKAE